MPTPIRKRRFGSNNTKKRSRQKNSRKRPRGKSRGNADGVDIGTTTGEAFASILKNDAAAGFGQSVFNFTEVH